MGKTTGFDLLNLLTEKTFEVVFVTAYDHYGIQAVKFAALDYLLKPVSRERFKTALDRVSKRLALSRLETSPPEVKLPDRLPVKHNGRIVFVPLADIDWIGSADNYVELHVGSQTFLMRETMNAISHDRFSAAPGKPMCSTGRS